MAMAWIPYSIIGFCLLFCVPLARAANITASGGWSKTFGPGDLTGGAGSDISSSYESGETATVLNVTATALWKVTIVRDDWAKGGLKVRESGQEYKDIPVSPAPAIDFITGYSGDKSGIECQYQLSGVSIKDGPDTYETIVTYTVADQ